MPMSTEATISVPNRYSDTGSPAKACTDCTMPERVMKVPTTAKVNARQAHMMLQRLNAPR